MVYYFAYGSNMNPVRMKQRKAFFSERFSGTLPGWKLIFQKLIPGPPRRGAATILPALQDHVEGVVYNITAQGIQHLDHYEGVPHHYTKERVTIKTRNSHTLECITYIGTPHTLRPTLKPTKEYIAHLLEGKDLISLKTFSRLLEIPTID